MATTELQGLELAERFYREYGEPMLREKFPELLGLVAVGLAGSGSECFGYDDALSRDHDFEAGFCLFLPDEGIVDRKAEFALERAYAALPREFMGVRRNPLNPVGGNRHGVLRIDEFFRQRTGTPDGNIALRDWFLLPEQSLAEAVGGKIFRDDLGTFTAIRERLAYLPDDVRLKKLAGHLLTMGQSGQYNYPRCLARGETAAAQLALYEFTKSSIHAVFLLNRHYLPYYKWSFRALRELPRLATLDAALEYLLSTPNTPDESKCKNDTVERVCATITDELRRQALSDYSGAELEGHAYTVNAKIIREEIRNLHILYAV